MVRGHGLEVKPPTYQIVGELDCRLVARGAIPISFKSDVVARPLTQPLPQPLRWGEECLAHMLLPI